MKSYIAVSKDGTECQILTAKNEHALFWLIDEHSNPYNFAFQSVDDVPVSIQIPIAKEFSDGDDWYVTVPKDKEVSLGEWTEDVIFSFLTAQEQSKWEHFTEEVKVEPYIRSDSK